MNDEFSWCDYGPFFLIGVKIFNFKSYHGRHVVGPFTDLTVIIGPNGSGKSNLMDAISFALLVRIDKLRLRNAASLTDDSYYQSDESDYSDKDSNQKVFVELCFKSKQDSNLTVFFRRSIARNKSYLYYINDENVTKNNYIEGLLKLGFNANDKSFLIFQEKIDRFIQDDPKNFTTILEELSGSQIFKREYDELKVRIHFILDQLIVINACIRHNVPRKKMNSICWSKRSKNSINQKDLLIFSIQKHTKIIHL